MENENISKLIEAISKDGDFQAKLQEAASQPPKRGVPEDKGLGSALLQAFAQSQGINFGSSDLSQLTQLLGAASQQGYGQSQNDGLQLFGSAPQPVQQAAQSAPQTAGQFIPFGGSASQPQSAQPAQTVTIDPAALEQFLQLFGGAQALQQQHAQQQAAYQAQQAQQAAQQSAPAGQFFSLGGDSGSGSGSPLGQLFGLGGSQQAAQQAQPASPLGQLFGGSGSSGSSGANGLLLQLLMQLLLK